MALVTRFVPRRVVIIGIMIFLVLLSSLWYVGGKALQEQRAKEAIENAKVLAEYERIRALISQKEAAGEKFERFSADSLGKNYTTEDLLISKEENPQTIKAYGLAIREALLPIIIQSLDPAALTLSILEDQNSEAAKNLSIIATRYQEVTRNLASITVPESATVAHLRLINNTREVAAILGAMAQINTEPIKALEASAVFHSRFQGFQAALGFLNAYFLERKVQFSASEQIPTPTFQ